MRGLAPKIMLGLFLFVLILGAATSALVYWGFDRGQEEASARSEEGLELQGRETLTSYAEFQSVIGQLQFGPAAAFAQQTSRYIFNLKARGGTVPWDPATLELLPNGRTLADTRPERVVDVVARFPLDAASERDLRDAAAFDALAPTLFATHAAQFPDASFQPIAVFFTSPTLATRYYPPIGAVQESNPDVEDVENFMRAIGPEENPEQRLIWTPPYEDNAGRGLVITAYTPVYEGTEFRGVIGVDLSIALLGRQLDLIQPTASGFAFYVDSGGFLLRSGASDLLIPETEAGNSGVAALLAEMSASRTGVARVTLQGRDFFVAYGPFGAIGGSFAVAAPVDELTEEAAVVAASVGDQGNRTVLVILAMMALLFLAALAASTFLTRRLLLTSIAELARGTRRIAAGDYGAQIAIRSNDELGDLATSFNAMAAEVQQRNVRLEERVRDRTRDLEDLVAQRDQRVRQLEAIAAVASTLTVRGRIEAMLTGVAEQIVKATAAEACAVGVMDPEEPRRVRVVGAANLGERATKALEAAATDGRLGDARVVTGARALLDTDGQAGVADAWDTLITVPIVYHDETAGMIFAFYAGEGASPSELAFLEAIADQAAVAIENAQLLGQAASAAALDERQRLARELHDSVSQALYGIGLGARTARRRLGTEGPADVIEPVEYVMSLAETGLTEMRALIFELRPESLEEEGLVAALSRQIAATQARWDISVTARLEAEPDVPLAAKEALYRIGQESLHNVVKHARAKHIEFTLATRDGVVVMEIRDDGMGFDLREEFPGHLGLRSMQERARGAGGDCTVVSELGEGTCVTVNIPLVAPNVNGRDKR